MHNWCKKRTKASFNNIEVDSVITRTLVCFKQKNAFFKLIYSQITFRLNRYIFLNITFEFYWRHFNICCKFGTNFRKVFAKIFCKKVYTDCMLLSCHVRVPEWAYTLKLLECQGTTCWKEAWYLKFKWQQRDSNLQPLSL